MTRALARELAIYLLLLALALAGAMSDWEIGTEFWPAVPVLLVFAFVFWFGVRDE